MNMRLSIVKLLPVVIALGGAAGPSRAAVIYSVSFNDQAGQFSSYYGAIESNVLAAGAQWASHMQESGSLEVVVNFDASTPTANGSSMTFGLFGNVSGINTWLQGAAYELIYGIDPNGTVADIQFTLGTDYLSNELWFDPDPALRSIPVPANKTDAVSVFLHEFGHAFAFNGWRDWILGTLPYPYNYQSTFDQWVVGSPSTGGLFFTGSTATSLYGGSVPLTNANLFHVGNNPPFEGTDLLGDLMNGVAFNRGFRYLISELDLAMALDAGVPIAPVPLPGSWLFALPAFAAVGRFARRRRASPS